MESHSYYLAKHAFYCFADNHYVFLDLRSDEYLCLGRAHSSLIDDVLNTRDVVEDRRSATVRLPDNDDPLRASVVNALLKRRLLVKDMADGKAAAVPTVRAPTANFSTVSDKSKPRIGLVDVWNFVVAAAGASIDLRWRSIERTVRRVEARKSYHGTSVAPVDNFVINDLFRIFQTLRPYYPRSYRCLFDSLALVHFLARYEVFPQWVFAVKLEPFAAHCWVQVEDLVINDLIDNVAGYTPIMNL